MPVFAPNNTLPFVQIAVFPEVLIIAGGGDIKLITTWSEPPCEGHAAFETVKVKVTLPALTSEGLGV